MAVSKNTVTLSTFKKWPFANDFDVNISDGRVTSVVCKYCSEVDYKDFLIEARYRNIKGSALKLIENFRKEVTFIAHLLLIMLVTVFLFMIGVRTNFSLMLQVSIQYLLVNNLQHHCLEARNL